eukprot:IDg23027t1
MTVFLLSKSPGCAGARGADAQGAVHGGADARMCGCSSAQMRMRGYFDALVRWHASTGSRVRRCVDAWMRGCIDTVVLWHRCTGMRCAGVKVS